jgi:hypothetical protein
MGMSDDLCMVMLLNDGLSGRMARNILMTSHFIISKWKEVEAYQNQGKVEPEGYEKPDVKCICGRGIKHQGWQECYSLEK